MGRKLERAIISHVTKENGAKKNKNVLKMFSKITISMIKNISALSDHEHDSVCRIIIGIGLSRR